MSVESLISYLSTITKLSPAYIGALRSSLEEEQYKPHQVIHAAGQVESRLWFIGTGFARSYYFDQTGKEHTLSFYLENEVIFSYKGFWGEATDYYLEVLAPATLISLPYEALNKFIEQYPETRALVNIFTRQRYYQELFKSRLMTWAAEERYHQFRKANPEIFKIASIRLIASYLNMTRENLSRLMGRET
jgi:CRP-like cAMP-binding protein